jgi:hypothetical protein
MVFASSDHTVNADEQRLYINAKGLYSSRFHDTMPGIFLVVFISMLLDVVYCLNINVA